MKRLFVYSATSLVVVALALLTLFVFYPRVTEGELRVLRIAVYEWGGYAPAVLAQEMGLFEKAEIEVQLIKASSPNEMNELFAAGKVDGICGIVLSDLLLLRSRGLSIQGVLLTDYSEDGDVILSRPEFATLESLKGKRVGVDGFNSFSHVFVAKMLTEHGLTNKDVELVNVPFGQVPDALIRNELDAGHTWGSPKERGVKVNLRVLARAGQVPGIVMESVAFRESLMQEAPETIRAFTNQFFVAQKELLRDPFASAIRMKEFFGNDPRFFADSLKEMHVFTLNENHEQMRGGEASPMMAKAKMINELLVETHQVDSADLYKSAFRSDFLP